MSTTTTTPVDMARAPFSTAAFAQLVRRLRHTNARYNRIACQFRRRLRPTHHAKRRADRAGLRIDTSKARACPSKYVSVNPLPILEKSAGSQTWSGGVYATTEPGSRGKEHGPAQGDAYMRGFSRKNVPRVTVRRCRSDGRQRIMLRLPPLKLSWSIDYACSTPFQGTVPGAPRLKPRQLPDEEDLVEEMILGSAFSPSSASDDSDSSSTFGVRLYSGLCITVPPRALKRKLQDAEVDCNLEQPKRFLKARWNESQAQ